MATVSKRMRAAREAVEAGKLYSIQEAATLLKSLDGVKFDESLDVAVNLGVDVRKSDQQVRGSLVLPHGQGRERRVAVFAPASEADAARAAGADIVGMEDLAEQVKRGELVCDVIVAHADAMPLMGKLGPILGPAGLMPNRKDGTVSADVAQAVRLVKAGQIRYRTGQGGVVHVAIGRKSFAPDAVAENFFALCAELKRAKPASSKGRYLKAATLSSSMSPGLPVDLAEYA